MARAAGHEKSKDLGYVKTNVAQVRADTGETGYLKNELPLTEGTHLLRFLPPKKAWRDGTERTFYFKYFVHYLKGVRGGVVCPTFTWKEKGCPVCAVGNRLYNSVDPDDIKKGKSLYRAESYVAHVINMRAPQDGVKLIRFTKRLKEGLITKFIPDDNPDGLDPLDPTDPDTGATIMVQVTKTKEGRTYQADIVKTNIPIPIKNWAQKLVDLEELVRGLTLSTTEINAIVTDAALGSDDHVPGLEDVDDLLDRRSSKLGAASSAELEEEEKEETESSKVREPESAVETDYECSECETTHEVGSKIWTKHLEYRVVAEDEKTEEEENSPYYCTECEVEHEEEEKLYPKHKKYEGKQSKVTARKGNSKSVDEYFCKRCEMVHLGDEKEFRVHRQYAEA